jgi:hypothetical protein
MMTTQDYNRLIDIMKRKADLVAELREHDFPSDEKLGPYMALLEENTRGYENGIRYIQALLDRMRSLTKKPELEPHNDRGELMTIEDWKECCERGGFIDYDGHGRFATAEGFTKIPVCPSERDYFELPSWATHIVWYNR